MIKEKPGRELVLDATSHVTVRDQHQPDKVAITNELQLMYALTRRALACDLIGVCKFEALDRWHVFLLNKLETPVAPGFARPSVEQILRADRAAWVVMAKKLESIKRRADGTLPMDDELGKLTVDATVLYHLLPNRSSHAEPAKPKIAGLGRSSKGVRLPRELVGIPGLTSMTRAGRRKCWSYNIMGKTCPGPVHDGACPKRKHVCMKCDGRHPLSECPN